MSALAATQIPKPADEQAFERASLTLWRCLLKDPAVQLNARRGQGQDGVDLYGNRDRDLDQLVGIQCKLKGDGKVLTEKEVRTEVEKALKFKPALREFYIVTTAPDDGDMHELARVITRELRASGREMLVYIWGWGNLEERILQYDEARKAFDPSYGPFSGRILDNTEELLRGQAETQTNLAQMHEALTQLVLPRAVAPGDATIVANVLESHLDGEIDTYRGLAVEGKPRVALPLFESLLARVAATASGRILFRIKANIGSCLFALGDDERAADLLAEAYEHAPTEPKAIANKAFSLLLQGRWQELLTFGEAALAEDPTNEGLAGYLVQAARFDDTITEPLDLLPEGLKTSAAVAIGRVDFLRRRGTPAEWRTAAKAAVDVHPGDPNAVQFAAEAEIDEILTSEGFQHSRFLAADERKRLTAAVDALIPLWDDARRSDADLRPEDAAICGNIVVALHMLDELARAMEIAQQGLALVPDDIGIVSRAAVVAFDQHDEVLARELLGKLPAGPDATVLAFQINASTRNWQGLAKLYDTELDQVPPVERPVVAAAGRLAKLKLADGCVVEDEVRAVAAEAEHEPRASIVVADFARAERFEQIADEAFHAALRLIDAESHIANRMMVALHAAKRGDWAVVADLLDGHIAEDHDSEELRTLARAFVNDSPIRQRALRFFERLPENICNLPFFLNAQGLLHFNRGALSEAETVLRRAIEVDPHLDNYLALFAVLRRTDRDEEIKPILDGIDFGKAKGSAGQKMVIAQTLRSVGEGQKALAFAYGVLQQDKNDPDVALRYFGLIMMDPDDGLIPAANIVATDCWVRLEGAQGQQNAFVIEEGVDRPADGVFTPTHPTAKAALGLKVGATFSMPAAFGDDRVWRVAEIKHKYLHALHDVMENFEKRFPDAKGFYTVTMQEGDIQPALDQVRRVSESNRKLADLYIVKHLPLNMVASHLGGDTIGFAEYIRSLNVDLQTCVGMHAQRESAIAIIRQHRAQGAVLDTYTAWTVATMDSFDVLKAVFGTLIVAQSTIDEIRELVGKQDTERGPSMTIAWHDGQYIKQEHSAEDIAARRAFIAEQLVKITASCEVRPAVAPDKPSEMATLLTEMFDAQVLDAANLAADNQMLVSEDLYYRQVAEQAVSARGVWLQPVFAFARENGLIDAARYAKVLVQLAWRRHGHVSIDPENLLEAFKADGSADITDFRALVAFIGNQNAEMRSHLTVVEAFLDYAWESKNTFDLKLMQATGILLERLISHRPKSWALVLAFIKNRAVADLRKYVDDWVRGHFLPHDDLAAAERDLQDMRSRSVEARIGRPLIKEKHRKKRGRRHGSSRGDA
ncbi:PIN domain-containing protein [Phyllobacterium sp. 22229]|uniref:PIN domain-containing protein n=1 Tax=Agrobacterium radiobacter TaxID=362 RepID=A0ABD5LKJ8_AGRRD